MGKVRAVEHGQDEEHCFFDLAALLVLRPTCRQRANGERDGIMTAGSPQIALRPLVQRTRLTLSVARFSTA